VSPRIVKDRIGPMGPDSTAVRAYRSGRILGFERGPGCDRLLALRPIINAQAYALPVNDRHELYTPLSFFAGDHLAIQFQPRPRETLPLDAEATLIVTYGSPTAPGSTS
jgi:hypothetical protein